MDRDEKRKRKEENLDTDLENQEPGREPIKDRSPAIDPYTGEVIPPEELPDIPVSEESFSDEVEDVPLAEDKAMEFLAIERGVNDDEVMDEIDDYTDDPDVLEDFAERQDMTGGSSELYESLVEHTAHTPNLTAEDIDADWDEIDVTGEEGVGATNPTPDQDIVEELGEAWGLEYDENEELDTYGKLKERDEDRYELDPESADDNEQPKDEDSEDEDDDEDLWKIPDPRDQEF